MKFNFFLLATASANCASKCSDFVENGINIINIRKDDLTCKAAENCDKECQIECIPTVEVCPAVTELETWLWIETGETVMQYVDKNYKREKKARSADDDETKAAKERKEWNKLVRQERKLLKQHEKRRMSENPQVFKKARSLGRRQWNEAFKAHYQFYESVEEKYKSICPDLNLTKGLWMPKFEDLSFKTAEFYHRYEDLPEMKKCLGKKNYYADESMGSFDIICIPEDRPDTCSSMNAKLTFAKLSIPFNLRPFCSEVGRTS